VSLERTGGLLPATLRFGGDNGIIICLYLVAQYQTVSEMKKQDITVCVDPCPDTDTGIFRIEAADDILRLLADAHDTEFTISELVDTTGVVRSTVWRAVDLLNSIGVVRIRETPQRNHVSIDPSRLHKDDAILAIDQPKFHEPIRTFADRVMRQSSRLTM
jgi:catalase (peroxidase I)